MTKPVSLATVPLSRFHAVDTGSHSSPAHRLQPDPAVTDPDVLAAYTDFSQRAPLVVAASTGIEAARRWIRQARARLLIVVDPLETFLGVVSAADLFSGRAGFAADADAGGKVTVADLMTPKSQLAGIPCAALARATADDVRKTLDAAQLPWLLVVDVDQHAVCGLVLREALDWSAELVPVLMPAQLSAEAPMLPLSG